MLLRFTDGALFATGAAPYAYRPVTTGESAPRVVLTVRLGQIETSAFLDTGGVYLLCSPELAVRLDLDPQDGMLTPPLDFGRGRFEGVLHRVHLTFVAADGDDLSTESTVFIPRLKPGEEWPEDFPCILGMQGCLERLRFAVDPYDDTFYFGELSQADY
jgi:hypothetical protein